MIERQLTWAELDLVADFTAGALSGPDADQIAMLVRTDPRWSAAYTALVAAEPLVRSALQTAAEAAPAMPAEVASRLGAALAGIRPEPRRQPPARPGARRHISAPGRHQPAAPSSGPGRRRVGAADRRRTRRLLTGAAAALMAIAVVGGIALVARFVPPPASEMAGDAPAVEAAGDAQSSPMLAPTAGTGADGGLLAGIQVLRTGTDYQADTLDLLADRPMPPPAASPDSAEAAPGTAADADRAAFQTAEELSRLATPAGFEQCLAAVATIQSGEVVAADFAEYEGAPAVVFLIRSGSSSTVIAVGPDCGEGGADELAVVDVD